MQEKEAAIIPGKEQAITEKQRIRLRRLRRYYDDVQRIRTSTSNRKTSEDVDLEPGDLEFFKLAADSLQGLEKKCITEIKGILKHIPIWKRYLELQPGIGPTLGALLLSELDVYKAPKPSSFHKYCGMHVVDGEAARKKKGQKVDYNPEMKSKLLKVMGEAFIKSSRKWEKPKDPETGKPTTDINQWVPKPPTVWKNVYDNRKHRRECQRVPVCMACNGTGIHRMTEDELKKDEERKQKIIAKGKVPKEKKKEPCKNCGGIGKNAPWGCNGTHRAADAIRYTCKIFLAEFWQVWREMEGLPVRPTYAEEYLGLPHHEHCACCPAPEAPFQFANRKVCGDCYAVLSGQALDLLRERYINQDTKTKNFDEYQKQQQAEKEERKKSRKMGKIQIEDQTTLINNL